MRRTAAVLLSLPLALTAGCGSGGGGTTAATPARTAASSGASGPASSGAPSSPPAGTGSSTPPPNPQEALERVKKEYVAPTPPANLPKVTGAPGSEPTIAKPTGSAPKKMVIEDLAPGTGKEVQVGDTVTIHYKGVAWDTGEEFDSSWKRGEPATFPLGQLIPGWQIGIPGMKEGGRRLLVIPPDLAYGPKGRHQLGGKTLVFVVDVVKAGA